MMTRYEPGTRKPRWWQVLLQSLMPALILAIVTWTAAAVSETKVQIAEHRAATAGEFKAIRAEMLEVRRDLIEHRSDSEKAALRIAIDHHRQEMTPCNKCHKK